MFGKPEWFRFAGPFPVPRNKSGFKYWAGWLSAIALPALVMRWFDLNIEMVIWGVISVTAFAFDIKAMRKDSRSKQELDSLYHIGEDEPVANSAATEKYELTAGKS